MRYAILILGLLVVACTPTTETVGVRDAQNQFSEGWDKDKAAEWLDARADWWLHAERTQRVTDEQGSVACFGCHTVHTYTFVRADLAPGTGSVPHIMNTIARRLAAGVNVPPWNVKPEGREQQSRGSEAINAALLLAYQEARSGAAQPSDRLLTAFDRLWHWQRLDGGWDWFNFSFEPLATIEAQHFAACQAAIAVGIAPGYYSDDSASPELRRHVEMLRTWVHNSRNKENLFGEAWLLRASTKLSGLLEPGERTEIVERLLEKQVTEGEDSGAWMLYNLNRWKYSQSAPPAIPRDLLPEARKPDPYSTGMISAILMDYGVPVDHPSIITAIAWLKAHQQDDGSWRAYSINKIRDKDDIAYLFMSDEATAWAALALLEFERRGGKGV
ncbi:MAG: hypothetical protein MRJ96_14995 [Nitrospirales bacterium]|nr:hypothetical protein [Nitrospira sp.]MDR4502748.1 hypothetical protein [Nitrospirales bacterium]